MFISSKKKEETIKRDNFKCQKCGHLGSKDDLRLYHHNNNLVTLCSICKHYAPGENFSEYLAEKIDGETLNTFRKHSRRATIGMQEKAKSGNIITRAPLGYKIADKQLVKDREPALKVKEIFLDFLNNNFSLNQLAKKHSFSVNGIKKILKNRTYIGYITFAGQSAKGKHEPIIDAQTFEMASRKLRG